MNDFEHRLTTLLDDVASSVNPRSNPDAVFVPTATVVPNNVRVFRPRYLAVAAAGLVFVGGSAFAMQKLSGDNPTRVAPATTPATESTAAPTTTAETTTTFATVGSTLPAESANKPLIEPRVVEPTVPVTEPTVPATEPTVAPVAIEFTARLGTNGLSKTPMTQGFYGNAQPGSAIHLASQYGAADATANSNGKWETTLTMVEVPPGTTVGVRITSSTSDRVREFSLLRPVPPPAVIEFRAKLGTNGLAGTPMTQGFYGTAQPGSAIRISCDGGVAETVAGPDGNWEAVLTVPDGPPGSTIGVRITSSTATVVREFSLVRPGTPAPVSIDFTANAGWATTDATPPVDEYWGTSTAGAVISITSPYGGVQVESNADGKWTARPTFPDAPVGVTFNVHITSSKGTAAYDFPLTRVAPV
ncbi:MAG: hypothetical protein ACXV8V_16770 [Ilumatobacteraceae bacterium]